jgi:hypothetical protein
MSGMQLYKYEGQGCTDMDVRDAYCIGMDARAHRYGCQGRTCMEGSDAQLKKIKM